MKINQAKVTEEIDHMTQFMDSDDRYSIAELISVGDQTWAEFCEKVDNDPDVEMCAAFLFGFHAANMSTVNLMEALAVFLPAHRQEIRDAAASVVHSSLQAMYKLRMMGDEG